MWVVNPRKRAIIDVNKALVELSGYSKEELLAMPPQNISPDPEGTMKILKNALVPGGEIFLERKVKKKDGTIVSVEISGRSAIINGQQVIISIFKDISERKKADEEKAKLILELERALAEVKRLSGLLPICSYCKKIRSDKGYWTILEEYIQNHSEAEFSHAICPDCVESLYGHEDWYKEHKKESKDSEGKDR